ncbi:MAG: lysoplasmalogenase family protein [Clostridiaceae bacterium]
MKNKIVWWNINIIIMIYISFLFLDISNKNSFINTDILKYISIILCFFISFLYSNTSISKVDLNLLRLGLFFTVLADLCLLFLDKYIIGIILFCIVQIIYLIRYERGEIIRNIIFLFIIAFIILISIYFMKLFYGEVENIFPVSLFYAICLLTSVIKAYKNKSYPCPNNYIIRWGMTLFLLCDISVAVYNVTNNLIYFPHIYTMNQVFLQFIWLFYLPSQLLISLSGLKFSIGFDRYFRNGS